MDSSRIFIKGLPPNISEAEFKTHFSAKHAITDAKLIPHRRIGYVGYKSHEDAAKAVKYFNKSYVRMSRIAVELARPISDQTLPPSRKAQREHLRAQRAKDTETESQEPQVTSSLKRKHVAIDEGDAKLKEFLEVMQPASRLNRQSLLGHEPEEPPTKIQALEIPEGESDDDYERIPKKTRAARASPTHELAPAAQIQISQVDADEVPTSTPLDVGAQDDKPTLEGQQLPAETSATDDDWLRSRTSRLLDLVDPSDGLPREPQPLELEGEASNKESAALESEIIEDVEDVNANTDSQNGQEVADATNDVKSLNATEEAIRSNGRLFVRNLPYIASEEDLRAHFAPFGALEEVHLPLDSSGQSKGFVLVQFDDPEAAVEAFHDLDGEPFQGRLLHILPASAKRNNKLDEFELAKLPLKKQKQIKKKAEASTTTFNWNSLYMNQDAVNSSIADRLGVSKSQLLDPSSADAGVKQAIAETTIIQESKAYFANNGVDLEAFKRRERGDTAILVKNFPYGMSLDDLRKMFEEFGQVLRVLMPPAGTIAIVEYAQAPQARAAFSALSYRRMKDSVLFLEKAPKALFKDVSTNEHMRVATHGQDAIDPKISASDLLEIENSEAASTSTLFVRNLNFTTTSAQLAEAFKPLDGFLSARVNTKTDPKKPGQVLSMGFGFVEFRSKSQAQAALSAMDGQSLDGHKLSIKASHRGLDAAEERRREDKAKKITGKRTKIVIKNLPFEASKRDVRTLFGTYGKLRSVRVPKKFDNSARGFAFADFVTAREAENALEALKDTHLLGRRLVIEFAEEDPLDAEEEIEKMQQKVGKQVSKVALQKLTGGGRKKFNIDSNENED